MLHFKYRKYEVNGRRDTIFIYISFTYLNEFLFIEEIKFSLFSLVIFISLTQIGLFSQSCSCPFVKQFQISTKLGLSLIKHYCCKLCTNSLVIRVKFTYKFYLELSIFCFVNRIKTCDFEHLKHGILLIK